MKVAWMTWLPVNGWVAEALQKQLNGKGEPVKLVPVTPVQAPIKKPKPRICPKCKTYVPGGPCPKCGCKK